MKEITYLFYTFGGAIGSLSPLIRFLPYSFPKVYDGWNSSGQVLYDELDSSKPAQAKSVIYSVSQKMMIRFTRPKVSCSSRIWSVTTVCKN
jgi:hypothetical protein